MKRHIVGALLVLALILTGAGVNARIMGRFLTEMEEITETAVAAQIGGNAPQARRLARTLEGRWARKQTYLESVLLHEELDDVTFALSDFISAAEQGDTAEVQAAGRRLRIRLAHLSALEQLRLGNIL